MRSKIHNSRCMGLWVSAVLVIATTGWAETPAWVDLGRSAELSDAQAMQGFGVAGSTGDVERDWMRAKDGARAEIIRQIRVAVSAEIADTLSERHGELTSATTMVTRSSAEMVLEGIRIAQQWYDAKEKVYYALAILDRMEEARRLNKQMTEANRAAQAYWDGAKTDRLEGRWMATLRGILRAQEERAQALSLEQIRSIIWKGEAVWEDARQAWGEDAPKPLSRADMERVLGRMVSQFELRAGSGDGQQVTWGAAPSEPLIVEAVWRMEDGERLVEGLPLRFELERGAGALDSVGVTDVQGQAACKVHRASGKGETVTVTARVDTAALGAEFLNPDRARWLAQLVGKRAVFTIQGSLRRVFVDVAETILGEDTGEKIVGTLLKQRIAEWGQIAAAEHEDSAAWILEGRAEVRAGQQTAGIISCYATVTLRLLEVESQTELFKKRVDGVKGFHIDQREAGRRALEKAGVQIAAEVVASMEGL
ncbi:MAG: LPP20 family lipoprotein [Candidatus Latescibacterota bacterium]